MNEVDYIGKKSVLEAIRQNKLTKFVVYQQGSTKGSTPVFRCTEAKTIDRAKQAFEDWADAILRLNPNNNRAYELLLFSQHASDADIEDTILDEKELKLNRDRSDKYKSDKVRFSFSLNPYNNFSGGFGGPGHVNVQEEIKKGIEDYKKDERLKDLMERVRQLEQEDADPEEAEEEDAFEKVSRLINLVNNKGGLKHAAGSSDSDDMGEELLEEDISKDKKVRMDRLKIALHRIKKLDPEWKALWKLSLLAKNKPTMFESYMKTLMSMEF